MWFQLITTKHHRLCCCRSHKGSNLALMVELLAGPLVGAAVADKLEERNWGNLLLAVDPELLGDADVIRARTQVAAASASCLVWLSLFAEEVILMVVSIGRWEGFDIT
jgi:hypothetical protein